LPGMPAHRVMFYKQNCLSFRKCSGVPSLHQL
jgi:hypothetical protein